jgi:hypothetical protein
LFLGLKDAPAYAYLIIGGFLAITLVVVAVFNKRWLQRLADRLAEIEHAVNYAARQAFGAHSDLLEWQKRVNERPTRFPRFTAFVGSRS